MRQLKIAQKFTSRDSLALEKYFKEVSKVQKLTADEEVQLAKKIKNGNMDALEKLVNANLRFVISVSKQYEGFGMALEDLISEGNIGLIKAARRFDDTRGYKFISYAVFWIRQSIMKALNENARIVRLPANQVAQIQKIQTEFAKLEQEFGSEPSADEVGNSLKISSESVSLLMGQTQKHISLDAPISSEDEAGSLLNMIPGDGPSPDDGIMHESMVAELNRCLGRLNEREAEVIKLYYGLDGNMPLLLTDIAGVMGLGRERVRQLKVQGIHKLQRMRVSTKLKVYL